MSRVLLANQFSLVGVSFISKHVKSTLELTFLPQTCSKCCSFCLQGDVGLMPLAGACLPPDS